MQVEEQVLIKSGGERLCGMLHCPDGEAFGSVVVCNPIFEERKSAHRVLVETARAICRAGWRVLRFDYRGCGDSSGFFHDSVPSDWLTDTRVAIDFLKERSGTGITGVIGLRLGGALALRMAVECPNIDSVVLWEPVVDGRDYFGQELRKKLMKEMVTFGQSRVTRVSLTEDLEGGKEIDFDGYAVSPALYRELCGIDLVRDAGGFSKRALVVHISHQDHPSKPMSRLHAALTDAGSRSELRTIKERPFWNLVGLVACRELIEQTVEWVKQPGAKREGGRGTANEGE